MLAGAAALGLMTGAATAQTSTSTSTTTITPVSPPVTVSTSQSSERAVTSEGVKTVTGGATTSTSTGQMAGTTISTTTYPLSNMVTTTKKTIQMVNGQPMETTTITHAYPGEPTPPPDTVTTRPLGPNER
jgi:hypothetical protein